jgi:hypothetical protein
VIWLCSYLAVGATIGVVLMTTVPAEDRGPYFFVLPGIMPIVWGILLIWLLLGWSLG